MTNTEIWERLETIRNTLIQARGFVNNSLLQLEILAREVHDQINPKDDNVPK